MTYPFPFNSNIGVLFPTLLIFFLHSSSLPFVVTQFGIDGDSNLAVIMDARAQYLIVEKVSFVTRVGRRMCLALLRE